MSEEKIRRQVFVTGATGFMGQRLAANLLSRGHSVRALVRPGSEAKLPPGSTPVIGDALDQNSYASAVPGCDTFVQLVGVSHPNPSKAAEFRAVDLVSAKAAIAARSECEETLRASRLNCTILRPWYVLGPGRHWPYMLSPFYWVLERIPATREGTTRLGMVTIDQMLATLTHAVENPAQGTRILGVPEIRQAGQAARGV